MSDEIEKLHFVRVYSPKLIPTYLVEQIRHREYDVNDFYKYQNNHCTIEENGEVILNPFNHLEVLANDNNEIKGFLWWLIDPLTKDIFINTFSMDEAYWYKGKAMKLASDHIKEKMKKLKLKKCYWITRYPKHSERNGFKRSKHVIMEYTEEQDG